MILKLVGLAAVGIRTDRLQGSMSSWLMLRTYRHPLFSVVVVAGGDDGGDLKKGKSQTCCNIPLTNTTNHVPATTLTCLTPSNSVNKVPTSPHTY